MINGDEKSNEFCYISIGGWCGTKGALNLLKLTTNQPTNIFDYVRSSTKGIIECLQNDFATFLPQNKVIDVRFTKWKPFIGEHFGFYHEASLTEQSVLDQFDRRKKRFINLCNSDKKCVFVRTCVLPDYEEELHDMKILQEVITNKYPNLSFIIVFIIPNQALTTYYDNLTDKIFIFCLNDGNRDINNPNNFNKIGNSYKNIFKFVSENNLFETIPQSNQDIKIARPSSNLCLVDGLPAVNYFEKFK